MRIITTLGLAQLMEARDPLVINVLAPEQHQKVHIPNTENVPVSDTDFLEKVEGLARDKEQPVIVYCAGPDCSASPAAAEKLDEADFKRVYDYEGGLRDWIAAGHAVNRHSQP